MTFGEVTCHFELNTPDFSLFQPKKSKVWGRWVELLITKWSGPLVGGGDYLCGRNTCWPTLERILGASGLLMRRMVEGGWVLLG